MEGGEVAVILVTPLAKGGRGGGACLVEGSNFMERALDPRSNFHAPGGFDFLYESSVIG